MHGRDTETQQVSQSILKSHGAFTNSSPVLFFHHAALNQLPVPFLAGHRCSQSWPIKVADVVAPSSHCWDTQLMSCHYAGSIDSRFSQLLLLKLARIFIALNLPQVSR